MKSRRIESETDEPATVGGGRSHPHRMRHNPDQGTMSPRIVPIVPPDPFRHLHGLRLVHNGVPSFRGRARIVFARTWQSNLIYRSARTHRTKSAIPATANSKTASSKNRRSFGKSASLRRSPESLKANSRNPATTKKINQSGISPCYAECARKVAGT
jgi:hypothetical protein